MLLFLAENDQGVTLIGLSPLFGLDADAREGTRFVGPFTAIWYAVFVIPFFLWVPIKSASTRAKGAVRRGLIELRDSLRALPGRRSLFAYLGASLLYRDALNGIYAFGGIYAAGVLGWSIVQIGVFGILAAGRGRGCLLAGGQAGHAFPAPTRELYGCCAAADGGLCHHRRTDRAWLCFCRGAGKDPTCPTSILTSCGGALIGAGGGSFGNRPHRHHDGAPGRPRGA